MADCVSLPNAAELVKELEHLLSLRDDDLAELVLRNNDVQNAIIYAADAIEQLVAENAKLKAERDAAPQWISVKDRLPSDDNEDWVLAVITEKNGYQWMPTRGEYRKGLDDWYFEETGWLRNHNGAFSVTHWMPLPEPPKEEEDAD